MANSHRRRNSIRSISINGRRFVKEPKIKEGLVGACQSLLRRSIRSISINGRRFVKEPKIKEGLVGACQSLLSSSNNWCPPFPDLPFNLIGEDQAVKLEEMFTEEEILAAVVGLNGDKAPGPDGFSLAFWSFSWDFMRDEVMSFFREFFEHNQFVKSLNATFLVLVPKGITVKDLKDLKTHRFSGKHLQNLNKSVGQHNQKGYEVDYLPVSVCVRRREADY